MRDPSLEMENPTPFLKVVMLLPRGSPSTNLGVILSASNLLPIVGLVCTIEYASYNKPCYTFLHSRPINIPL